MSNENGWTGARALSGRFISRHSARMPDPNRSERRTRLSAETLTVALLLTVAVVWAFRQIYSPDVGFHLKAGRWILEHLRVPSQDLFTYTLTGRPYVDLYWLYQTIIALAERAAGALGLVALNAALVGVTFALLFYRAHRRGTLSSRPAWPLWGMLGIASMAMLFETRPHTFSWVFLNVTLLILEEYRRGNARPLYWLVPVMLLWVNTHSLFILGWLAVAVFTVMEMWERRSLRSPLLRVLGLCIAVSFVNPYGVNGLLLPFQQFQFLQGANVFNATIDEYQTPLSLAGYTVNGGFVLLQPLFPFHLFLVLSGVAFILTLRRRPRSDLLLYLIFLCVALSALKNVGYFIVAVLPMFASGPIGVAADEKPDAVERAVNAVTRLFTSRVSKVLTSLVAVLILWSVVTDRYYVHQRSNSRIGYEVNPLVLPAEAASFINARHLSGRVLNHFNDGGFLMWALDRPVVIDGRNELIGEEFYLEYMTLWGIPDKSAILDRFRPDIVLVPHFFEPTWVSWFAADSAWRLVYYDHLSAVYLRPGYAPEVPSAGPMEWLGPGPLVPREAVDALLLRPEPNDLAAMFGRIDYPQRWIGLASFAFNQGWLEPAVQYGLRALLESTEPEPEIFFDLGNIFFKGQDWIRAAFCYRRYLQSGDDAVARDRLALMQRRGLTP